MKPRFVIRLERWERSLAYQIRVFDKSRLVPTNNVTFADNSPGVTLLYYKNVNNKPEVSIALPDLPITHEVRSTTFASNLIRDAAYERALDTLMDFAIQNNEVLRRFDGSYDKGGLYDF